MAKIPLRDYLKGVDELIEKGKIDETIAHCRHILKEFPKNVSTYRLLGKAHLEEKRYGDAGDIFQRVLSSVPDDFISQVGMSIIREDEGNMDTSIWHMERAFEAQPSNRGVQDELRRLYGQREGFAPPKVRLTKGALARMYSHGDLYNQAIGELKSALKEESQRPDLMVLLAEMYMKTGQESEALGVCKEIIDKLPYCLYANHLSADILNNSNQSQEASAYLKKVEELDPYISQLESDGKADDVASESVMLEHLVLQSGVLEPQEMPRSWTGALEPLAGEDSEFQEEDLPDWLSVPAEEESSEEEQKIDAPLSTSELRALKELAPDAPDDWDIDSEPKEFDDGGGSEEESMPNWMQELKPDEAEEISDSPINPFEEEAIEESPVAQNDAELKLTGDGQMEADQNEDQPSAFESAENDEEKDEDGGLAWLEGLAAKQGAEEEELITEPEERHEESPEWTGNEDGSQNIDKKSMTWWLDELEESVDEAEEDKGGEQTSTKKLEAMQEIAEEINEGAISDKSEDTEITEIEEIAVESESEDQDEATDWLKELASAAEEKSGETEKSAGEAFDDPPDWLDELRQDADESGLGTAEKPEDAKGEEEPSNDRFGGGDDWLSEGEDDSRPDKEIEEVIDIAKDTSEAREDSASEWVPENSISEMDSDEELQAEAEMDSEIAAAEKIEVPASKKTGSLDNQELSQKLEQARQAINYEKFDDAVDQYGSVLKSKRFVDEVIADIQAALSRNPKHVGLWQTLGDAYMRADRLGDALESYSKAEDLL